MDTRKDGSSPVPEEQLHGLVDGRLSAAEADRVREHLAGDSEAAAAVAAWQAQRAALKNQYAQDDGGPLSASLLAAAERVQQVRDRASQWSRWGGLAASVLLAFGSGWVASTQWHGRPGDGPVAGQEPARHFAREAAVAFAVYQPEVRHPVEVPAAQQEHLVQWLSKRLGRPLKIPLLTAQGYELVGGRLLPGDDGARAQFMYQNSTGQRLTLYLGALKPGAAESNKETAFRFLAEGPVPGFYWVDQGFGYALSGQLPRPALQELATAVYRQL